MVITVGLKVVFISGLLYIYCMGFRHSLDTNDVYCG